jgi:hypothetical protein
MSNALAIQGGATAGVTVTTGASSGTAGSITIGNTTGANTQAINLGTNATASSVTNVTIGSTVGVSQTTLQAGSQGIVAKGSNSTTAFQVQRATGTTILGVDTTNSSVGIGTSSPSNTFSVSPLYYSTGTAYQDNSGSATTTITGSGTTWTSAMVGMEFIFSSGQKETITAFTDTTHLTGSVSQSVASSGSPIAYEIHQPVFYVSNTSQVSQRSFTNSATAMQVQNAAGNNVFAVDTSNNQIVLGTSNSITGTIAFKGSSGTGALLLTGPNSPNSNNYTLSLPAIGQNDTVCTNTTQSSACSNYAAANGGSGYIQNQNALNQAADFRISGTGRANTSILTPTLDRASAGTLSIGTDTTNTTGLTIGNGSMTSDFAITAGTGALNLSTQGTGGITIRNLAAGNIGIGDNAVSQTITIGNAQGSTGLVLNAGTGNIALDGLGNTNYTIGASATTGAITIGGSAQTGTIGIGTGTGAQSLNFGTGGTGTKTVTIGSTAGNSALTLQTGGTGQLLLSGGTGAITLQNQGTGAINIANNTVDNTVNIGKTGTTANSTTLNLATSNGGAQTINIGGTGGSGNSHSGTVVTLEGGASQLQIANGGNVFTRQHLAVNRHGFIIS